MPGGLELVELGRVVKAHGLRGEILVAPHGGCQEALLRISRVYLRRQDAKAKPWPVLACRMHSGRVLMAVDGLDGRDKAEPWRDAAVLGRARDVAAADPQRWGALAWIGATVELSQGEILGELRSVALVAGQELWTVVGADGSRYVLPAALRVQAVTDRLVIDPPEGLLDLCRQEDGVP
ncbi:ribosome maturation factor RimM [Thermodesulfomicrobium sp. WS]|uniref:ribosome maturation factor RimM n=1 Tax=Thermodesulfomicrobium sp. WS TaxID=3004129 RepID=UPI00249144A8|nr:hypothetical protein [Thermodesulfomicrobium sp. WS]BDV00036.1 ribosome maturation factor RimM [Thermodesulfomicrobium sp. WS]